MKQTCKARTKSGTRCNAAATSSGYCFAHAEDLKAKRDAARVLGGRNRRRIANDVPFPADVDPSTVKGLTQLLAVLIRQCWELENSIAKHRAMAYLCQVQRGIIESGEIETRLTALENLTSGMDKAR